MANDGVRIEGLRKVVRELQDLGLEVEDLKAAFGSIAAEGARLAAGFAPTRTGKLAGTIRGNKAKGKAVVMAGRARVSYAGAINYGWPKRGIKASMFMQRADKALQPRALEMLEDQINEAVKSRGLA